MKTCSSPLRTILARVLGLASRLGATENGIHLRGQRPKSTTATNNPRQTQGEPSGGRNWLTLHSARHRTEHGKCMYNLPSLSKSSSPQLASAYRMAHMAPGKNNMTLLPRQSTVTSKHFLKTTWTSPTLNGMECMGMSRYSTAFLLTFYHREPRPLVDKCGIICGILAGQPSEKGYHDATIAAFKAIRDAGNATTFNEKVTTHRRGDFPAINTGVSYGKGQKEPRSLRTDPYTEMIEGLLESRDIQRLANFGSGECLIS